MTQHEQLAGHERRDVRIRPVALAVIGLLALLVILGAAVALLLRHFERREAASSTPASPLGVRDTPPAPRLQVAPRKDLRTLRAEEDQLLESYAWVDRRAGTVRIPIERAMELLAERRRGEGRR